MSAARRRTDLLVTAFEDHAETVLLDDATGKVASLNQTAAAVWYLCDGQRDEAQIAKELAGSFPGVELSRIEHDVRTILAELARLELVRA